jgi:hypothetical protein
MFLMMIRESGTALRISAHVSITGSTSFSTALNEPNVTYPAARDGAGATSGASTGG